MPGLWFLPPIRDTDAWWRIAPRGRVNILEAAVVIPQRDPLDFDAERLIVEDGIHVLDRVVEVCRGDHELVLVDLGGELQSPDLDWEYWCHASLHHGLHRNRQGWRGGRGAG